MTKPDPKPPNPNRPITNEETRAWREAMLTDTKRTAWAIERAADLLDQLLHHFTSAIRFAATIESEPLTTSTTGGVVTDLKGSATMPTQTGTILANCRAVLKLIPLDVDGNAKALNGDLQVTTTEPAAYALDSTDPLLLVVKCDPPADLDAQPITHMNCQDADFEPNVDIEFQWTKGVILVKDAVQFTATIESESIA
jgi:hypothetical protein